MRNLKLEKGSCDAGIPSSWSSLRMAACLTPCTEPFATSVGVSTSGGDIPWSGWEQHVLVHTYMDGWMDRVRILNIGLVQYV